MFPDCEPQSNQAVLAPSTCAGQSHTSASASRLAPIFKILTAMLTIPRSLRPPGNSRAREFPTLCPPALRGNSPSLKSPLPSTPLPASKSSSKIAFDNSNERYRENFWSGAILPCACRGAHQQPAASPLRASNCEDFSTRPAGISYLPRESAVNPSPW